MTRSTRLHVVRNRSPSRPAGVERGPLGALSLALEPVGSLGGSVLGATVDDVMTRSVQTVAVDLSVESASWLLLDRGLDCAPVVDLSGRLVGIVSVLDLLRERCETGDTEEHVPRRGRDGPRADPGFSSTRIARSTVGEIMSPITLAVRGSSSLIVAAALMGFEGVQALPVTRGGQVIGVLSSLDILRWLSRKAGYTGAAREQLARIEGGDREPRPLVTQGPHSMDPRSMR